LWPAHADKVAAIAAKPGLRRVVAVLAWPYAGAGSAAVICDCCAAGRRETSDIKGQDMKSSFARRMFIAGASGAIGRILSRLLVEDGFIVIGTTRKSERVGMLESLGVTPVVVDVFDSDSLHSAILSARPDVVVHQLTDLPPGLDPKLMPEARIRNAHLREIGTRNLVSAAVAAHATQFVAQSISFAYAPGVMPYIEESPLNVASTDEAASLSARAVASLEQQVLGGPFAATVLRYGKLYGPGTGFDAPPPGGPLHVDAAAEAAHLSITSGRSGIFNIAEEDGTISSAKARSLLGWNPAFRIAGDG